MYCIPKKVCFSDVVKEKDGESVVEVPCKMFDGSLNFSKHKMLANFSIKCLNDTRMDNNVNITNTLKYIHLIGVLKHYTSIYEFIYQCKNNMLNILEKLENIEKERMINDITKYLEIKNKECDPYWDQPVFIKNAKKRTIQGASLIPRCSRDSSTLSIKLTVEWIPNIKIFITFLENIEEYLFFN
jgi:hypothetical protein